MEGTVPCSMGVQKSKLFNFPPQPNNVAYLTPARDKCDWPPFQAPKKHVNMAEVTPVACGALQIYNEQVRDLFGSGGSGHSLRVREHPTRGAFVEGLSARQVTCYQQVQDLLEDGMSARSARRISVNY